MLVSRQSSSGSLIFCKYTRPELCMYATVALTHYENTPKQHTAIFHGCKNDDFRLKCFYSFHIFAQNIEYPQSMFKSKNKKIMYTPVNPSFTI